MYLEATVEPLEGLLAARASGHAQAALTLALTEWHRTKHTVVAEVIDLLSVEALEALTTQVADPRIGSALCALLETPELMVWDAEHSRPIYEPVASLIIAQGDVRCIERLQALERAPRAKNKSLREVVTELISPLVRGLALVEVSRLENEVGWRALLPEASGRAPTASERALLEAVYASTRDDRLRSVYADALLERGDSRGELISLQLAPHQTPKQRKRVNVLIKANRERWLGPLATVLNHLVFERGFLCSAELTQSSVATEETWQTAAADHRLGTLEVLRQGRGNAKHYTAFLASGALRNLKRVELPSYQLLPLLGRPPLSESVEHVLLPNRGSLQHLEKLGALEMRALTTLTTPLLLNESAQWLQYLISSGLIKRLRHYKVSSGWGVSQPLVQEVFARWHCLEKARSLAVQTVWSPDESPRHLLLERAGQGDALRLWVHASFEKEAQNLLAHHFSGPVTEVHLFDRDAWGSTDDSALRRVVEARGATLHLYSGGVPSAPQ